MAAFIIYFLKRVKAVKNLTFRCSFKIIIVKFQILLNLFQIALPYFKMRSTANKVCGIIDFSGSNYRGNFLVREVGMVGIGRRFRRAKGEVYDFRPFIISMAEDFSPQRKRRKTFRYRRRRMKIFDLDDLEDRLLHFYDTVRTRRRDVIAYKGGIIERDILEDLGIPYLNLEDLGCPRWDDMQSRKYEELSCEYHGRRNLHCPISEVASFKKWYVDHYG